MSAHEAAQFVDSIIMAVVGLIGAIIWLGFAISISSNLRSTRREIEKQTLLLAQIVKHTQPPELLNAKKPDIAADYRLNEPRVHLGLVLFLLVGTAIVLGIIARATGHK